MCLGAQNAPACMRPRESPEAIISNNSMANALQQVAAARERLSEALSVSDVPAMKAKLADLENQASSAGEGGGGLWDDPTKAQALLGRITHLRSVPDGYA